MAVEIFFLTAFSGLLSVFVFCHKLNQFFEKSSVLWGNAHSNILANYSMSLSRKAGLTFRKLSLTGTRLERFLLAIFDLEPYIKLEVILRSGWAPSGKLEFHHFNSQNSLKKSTYFIP
jgi:hypothetical protein